MAKIFLNIEAESADDLYQTLDGLNRRTVYTEAAQELVDREASYQEDDAARTEMQAKRTRRTKAQINKDEAAAERAKAALGKAADPFSEQVKAVVAEDAAASAVTIDDVKKAMIAFQDKGTPAEMQALFRKYDGAERLSELKPGHYAAAHADLTA